MDHLSGTTVMSYYCEEFEWILFERSRSQINAYDQFCLFTCVACVKLARGFQFLLTSTPFKFCLPAWTLPSIFQFAHIYHIQRTCLWKYTIFVDGRTLNTFLKYRNSYRSLLSRTPFTSLEKSNEITHFFFKSSQILTKKNKYGGDFYIFLRISIGWYFSEPFERQ